MGSWRNVKRITKFWALNSSADEAAIRKAYRKAVRQNHPDINANSKKAHKRTRELNAAIETLLNSDLRQQYDEKLAIREAKKLERRRRRTERYRKQKAAEQTSAYAAPSEPDLSFQDPPPRRRPPQADFRDYAAPPRNWSDNRNASRNNSKVWMALSVVFCFGVLGLTAFAGPLIEMAKDFQLASWLDDTEANGETTQFSGEQNSKTDDSSDPEEANPVEPDFVNPFIDKPEPDFNVRPPMNPIQANPPRQFPTGEASREESAFNAPAEPNEPGDPTSTSSTASVVSPESQGPPAMGALANPPVVAQPFQLRQPVPSREAQYEVELKLTELYKPEFDAAKRKTGVDQLKALEELATRMFEMHETSDDTAYKFVYLRAAHRTALESGHPALTERVIDSIAEQFRG